jgi:hypothetical protein
MDQEREVIRGNQARDLLENPLMVEALTTIRDTIRAQWESSPARDLEGREKLWVMLKLLGNLEGHLKEVLETGKLAQIQVNQKQSLLDRAKQWSGIS